MTLQKLLLYLKGKKVVRRVGGREGGNPGPYLLLTIEKRSFAWGLKEKPSTERKADAPSFGEHSWEPLRWEDSWEGEACRGSIVSAVEWKARAW